MISAEQLSKRVDALRLHSWALEKDSVELPEAVEQLDVVGKIEALMNVLLNDTLKKHGYEYTLNHDVDCRTFRIKIEALASLVDEACTLKKEFGPTHFPPPRRERPQIEIHYLDNGLWQASQQFLAFEKDLDIYNKLKEDVEATAKEADKEQDNLAAELTRNLFWLRQVHKTNTDEMLQQQCIQDVVQSMIPEGPVKVEVAQGQSLQDAIFSALHTAGSRPAPPIQVENQESVNQSEDLPF